MMRLVILGLGISLGLLASSWARASDEESCRELKAKAEVVKRDLERMDAQLEFCIEHGRDCHELQRSRLIAIEELAALEEQLKLSCD